MFCNYFKFKQLVFACLFVCLYSCKDLEISREENAYLNKQYDIKVRSFVPFDLLGLDWDWDWIQSKRFSEATYGNSDGLFLGDGHDRRFSTDDRKSARIHYLTRFDIDKGKFGEVTGCSVTNKVKNGRILKETAEPKFKYINKPRIENGPYSGEEVLKFYSHIYANNPFKWGSPDIDIFSDFEITENISDRYIRIKGKIRGDRFPSKEAYITDSRGQSVFIGVRKYQGGLRSLNGKGEYNSTDEISFNFKIKTDYRGNFVEVIDEWGYTHSIYSWNSKFENKSIH